MLLGPHESDDSTLGDEHNIQYILQVKGKHEFPRRGGKTNLDLGRWDQSVSDTFP